MEVATRGAASVHPAELQAPGLLRFVLSVVAVLSAVLTLDFVTPSAAHAAWTAPAGTRGWCTYVPNEVCFADPQSACALSHQVYGGPGQLFSYTDRKDWWDKQCQWEYKFGFSYAPNVTFGCESLITRVAPGYCVQSGDSFASADCECDADQGGTPRPETPFPISILDGGKSFAEVDFATSDGGLRVLRHFASRPASGPGNDFIAPPLGFANWRFGLGMELQLGDAWAVSNVVGLATPKGGQYQFVKSGSLMTPQVTSARPIKRTDYSLDFVGTLPATAAEVLAAPSEWIVKDRENRTWRLATTLNPNTGKFDVARPLRLVEPGGLELAFDYVGGGLASVTDTYGRAMNFTWIRIDGRPRAISQISLPDGTSLNYTYESATAGTGQPERLTTVERREGASVLDRESYDYGDERFPTLVTAVRNRDGALRWSVTYDEYGRALTSQGPGGTQAYSVAYGPSGVTFTRTVTGPLGKAEVYTFTRSGTQYNIKLASITATASANSPATSRTPTYSGNYLATDTDAEGRVTAYTRDALARPTQVVEGQGATVARTTGYTWHSAWNATTQVREPGLTTDHSLVAGTSAGPFVPVYVAVVNFPYSGAEQTYVVPPSVSTVLIDIWGGAGGNGNYSVGAWSGAGGQLRASFVVASGDVVKLEVGGGGRGAMRNADGGLGGWPDGGSGGKGDDGSGGGGGSTRFYINGVLMAVAGGGGGSGGYGSAGSAGAAGGEIGQRAAGSGGLGGTQSAGGVDSSDSANANKAGRSLLAFPGGQRTGGWGSSAGNNTTTTSDDGGGGGGGYWGGGGGGGDGQSGGGGSSWVHMSAIAPQNFVGNRQTPARSVEGLPALAAGVNSAANGPAVAGGDGYAILRFK